ncbi:MAG: DUF4276 family protein [Gemmatimonadota bacterium]|nr:DUF4276 family protein [Gemmatimonadota bacterium]MDE2871654.1 DUF4276 family protein [Gemmatimonadota bacterium]
MRVLAVVEGPTEERFVKGLLAEPLGRRGVFITARRPGHPGRQGGVPPWRNLQRELVGLLKEDANRHVTTMFDYYGMPVSWPGREEARNSSHAEKAELVEQAMLHRIGEALGGDPRTLRFIPYVQMHEFEALLFSKPQLLAEVVSGERHTRRVPQELERIVAAFGSPEEIDDNPDTAPSKRILALAPQYQKVIDGNLAASRIGLAAMRRKCPHFAGWVGRLRALGRLP